MVENRPCTEKLRERKQTARNDIANYCIVQLYHATISMQFFVNAKNHSSLHQYVYYLEQLLLMNCKMLQSGLLPPIYSISQTRILSTLQQKKIFASNDDYISNRHVSCISASSNIIFLRQPLLRQNQTET